VDTITAEQQEMNKLHDVMVLKKNSYYAVKEDGKAKTKALREYLKAQSAYEELRVQLAQKAKIHQHHNPDIEIITLTKDDMVDHPPHYQGEIECIDAIKSAAGEHFVYHCTSTAMKYLWRWDSKAAPAEDLKKARWYIDKAIEEVEDA